MEQANLTLTIVFNDETPNAVLSIYNENFYFDYGIHKRNNVHQLTADIRIDDNESLEIFQQFLTNNYKNITKINNFKEIIIDIFRPSQNSQHSICTLKGESIKDYIFGCRNTFNDNHYVEIIFEII